MFITIALKIFKCKQKAYRDVYDKFDNLLVNSLET